MHYHSIILIRNYDLQNNEVYLRTRVTYGVLSPRYLFPTILSRCDENNFGTPSREYNYFDIPSTKGKNII